MWQEMTKLRNHKVLVLRGGFSFQVEYMRDKQCD